MGSYRFTVAVNTRVLIPNKLEGIGRFTHEILRRLVPQMNDTHFIFLFDRNPPVSFIYSDNVTPIACFPPTRHVFLYYLWLQHGVRPLLNRLKPDLFFSPDGLGVLNTPVPQIPVIHDLNFEHHPEFHRFWARHYYRFFFPRFARNAFRIMTVSEFSKKDIMNCYGIPENLIRVVSNGVSENFRPLQEEKKTGVRKKISGGRRYFVYVGSLHPRKNIAGLIRAFRIFKEKYSSSFALVLAGPVYWGMKDIFRNLKENQVEEDVIFTNRLKDEELSSVIGAAEALVYVPFFEGFGIPVLEAFACGCPVIASSVTSIPEVAGNAALLVNPHKSDEIADAMHRILDNKELTRTLILEGTSRLKNFRWENAALKVREILYEVLNTFSQKHEKK